MGAVYLAVDERLGRQVALKQIHSDRLYDHRVRARFAREARALSQLDHPHLCKLFEAGEHDGNPYLVMQYIRGHTLAKELDAARSSRESVENRRESGRGTSTSPSTHDEIMAVAVRIETIARALHHAHETGLVHRDVKPGNIMIRPDGAPVVLDFGLVRDEQETDLLLTASNQQLGTPLYMSPEQIVPEGRGSDPRTDVYALGVTLYECLTLARPFEAPTRHELFAKILRDEPAPLRHHNRRIPFDLSVVVETAMAKDPEFRYRSAHELAEDLRRVRTFEPILARRAGIPVRVWRWTQRNRIAAWFLAAMTVATTAIAGLWMLSASNARRATEALDRFELLRYREELDQTAEDSLDLAPPWPDSTPRIEHWLESKGRPLAAALPRVGVARDELMLAAGEQEDSLERFLHRALVGLAVDLGKFAGPGGTLAVVEDRLIWSQRVGELSIDRHTASWEKAHEAIRKADGDTASELYASDPPLELEPQMGLAPIGMNPVSKLWEFYHLRSAVDPSLVPAHRPDGSLLLDGSSGLVFVLLPGGIFRMGSPEARQEQDQIEVPATEVRLEPFLLSRFEMTQGQWTRLLGTNPSHLRSPFIDEEDRHPVEMVSWTQCRRALQLEGLCLPTEAQWEYACRAGTTGEWSVPFEQLGSTANLADRFAHENGGHDGWKYELQLEDGFLATAPVGSLAANAFGLHDMHGNVWECCEDRYHSYQHPPEPGTGLRRGSPANTSRMFRGGAFTTGAPDARSAHRLSKEEDYRELEFGVRPARRVLFSGQ